MLLPIKSVNLNIDQNKLIRQSNTGTSGVLEREDKRDRKTI